LVSSNGLAKPVSLDDPIGTDLALEIQEELAAGRGLRHATEHFGESAIIALASRAKTLQPLMLSDDYDARIAANARGIRSFSVHRMLHLMIRQGKVLEKEAAAFADALFAAGRSLDYTGAELTSGRLGRVGRP